MSAHLRTGVDLIEIDRFASAYQRYSQRFLQHLFTPREISENGASMPSLAARFAAKEAVAKALGTGIGQITWRDVEICRGDLGEPVLNLHGPALELAQRLELTHWSLSLSHSQTHAIAFVVATSE